jgi:Ca2+/H+ antiporter
MTCGQVVSLILGALLLLPGGCFLFFGIGFSSDAQEFSGLGIVMLLIAVGILFIVWLLFRYAFRRKPPPPPSLPGV